MDVRHVKHGTFEQGQDARSHPYVGRDETLDGLLQFERYFAPGATGGMAIHMLDKNAQREGVHGVDGTGRHCVPPILQPFGAAIFVGGDGTLQMPEERGGTATAVTYADGSQEGVVEQLEVAAGCHVDAGGAQRTVGQLGRVVEESEGIYQVVQPPRHLVGILRRAGERIQVILEGYGPFSYDKQFAGFQHVRAEGLMRRPITEVRRSVAIGIIGVQRGIHLQQIGMDQRLALAKVLDRRHQLVVGGIARPGTERGGGQRRLGGFEH